MRKPFVARSRTSALLHEQRRDGMSIVTVSVGAAFTRNQTGAKLEKIIHEADRALYLAKASGRNCARLFDPNDPQSSDESENIAALLKIAIGQDLVSLVYQPIQNVASGRVEAVEALMRLRMLDGTAGSAEPVHSRRGANRRHPGARALGDTNGVPRAAGGQPCPCRQRQRLADPAQDARLRDVGCGDPGRDRRSRQQARLRNHRRARDGDALGHPSLHQRPEAARASGYGSTISGRASPDFRGFA